MKEGKLKMSNKRFLAIMVPIMAIVLIIAVAVTCVANFFEASLDTYVGRGNRIVNNPENTENWDLEHYNQKYKQAGGEDGSLKAAEKVSKAISDEGTILLKNSNSALPLAKNTKVSPFGLRYRAPIYGGTGSGKVNTTDKAVWSPKSGLEKHFEVNAVVENKIETNKPYAMSATERKQSEPTGSGTTFSGAETDIFEFDPQIYAGTETSCRDTVGIVFIGRIGGEGANLLATPYYDGTPHNLALSDYEKGTIKFAKQNCKKTVAIINSSNVMEIGALMSGEYECDAIVWIGGPGTTGYESLADVLVGEVNPSGRTADIWDANILANPTMQNYGIRTYANASDTVLWPNMKGIHYYEYEEGVYYGYRYYETAVVMDKDFVYGELDANGGIKTAGQVLYPFGYGLSYTTFSQKIVSVKDGGDNVSVTVEVKNTGTKDGKEVVQLYQTAPYTQFDIDYEIEKPAKVLIAFGKAEVKAGQTERITLSFAKEDLASYCYTRDNGDGTEGCYVLEGGDYVISLGKNSHDVWGTETVKIGNTIWYDNSAPRKSETIAQSKWDENGNSLNFPAKAEQDSSAKYIAATNRFPDLNDYMHKEATIFSRKDWKGTFPTAPDENKTISEERLQKIVAYDVENDPRTGNGKDSVWYKEEAPASKQKNNFTFADMRGVDYYSEQWDLYLDQIDYDSEELYTMLFKAAFSTGKLDSIGKPVSADSDGPQGFGKTGVDGGIASFAYVTETVVGSAWNQDLAYAYGESIAQEALVLKINGWYGPGLNLHRSAFCGRNFEYYSEDPLLTGLLGGRCISGAEQNGLVVYTKHFGAHTHEDTSVQLCAWMTEQAYRETDLRAFELGIKTARRTLKYISDVNGTVSTKTVRGSSGIMGCATLLGTEWQGASYGLITEILRGEWGFQGVATTDMALYNFKGVSDKIMRSGADLRMYFMPSKASDTTSATALHRFRDAVKHICFAYANSNLTQGAAPGAIITYTMSPWKIGLIIADVLVGLLIAGGAVWIVLRFLDEKKNPEKYKHTEKI